MKKSSPAKSRLNAFLLPYKPELEYRFHPVRKWRFDYCWPALALAVEFEGGIFVHGGHNRPTIYTDNCSKYNTAAILGYTVLRFTAHHVLLGEAERTFQTAWEMKREIRAIARCAIKRSER